VVVFAAGWAQVAAAGRSRQFLLCNAPQRPSCSHVTVTFSVLIVDDSRSFLDVGRDLLERQGVRVVGLASTSAEALRQSAELHPEVILIDITLAGESGFDPRLAAG
jgi:PleD family two-component response regulator